MTTPTICPTCGNPIQPFMHGTCTICQRNQQEQKRYGYHRPNPRPKATPPRLHPSKKQPQATRSCPICDKQIPTPRYFGHMWHAHGTDPYTPKAELQRLRRRQTPKQAPDAPPAPSTPTIPCPICRAPIATTHQQHHQTYHQQAEQSFTQSNLRLGINRLLEDIYQKPHHISHILQHHGLSPSHLQHLAGTKRRFFFRLLTARLHTWLTTTLPPLEANLIHRLYSLDGLPKPDPTDLAPEYALTLTHLHRLSHQTLTFLRHPNNRQKLEQTIYATATRHLNPD